MDGGTVGQSSLSRWLQMPADNSYEEAVLQSRSGSSDRLPTAAQAHVAALSKALDADHGIRARAVHLVIVEQTLKCRILGGFDAIPVPVLAQAAAQILRLSSFRLSPELQLLLKCMRRAIAIEALPILRAALDSRTEFIDTSKPAVLHGSETDASDKWRFSDPDPSGRTHKEDQTEYIEDGFPDTRSPDECEKVPRQMPLGSKEVVGTRNKWR